MRRVRNSQLRLLAECGWAYAEAYVHGTQGMPAPALLGGQNVHAAIRAAVHEILSGSPFLNIHEIAYRVVRGDDELYQDALEVLTRFTESLAEDFSIDPKGAFLIEERQEMQVDVRGEPYVFYGTPDLVERASRTRCRITDFKTHRQVISKEAFMADVQLPRYALLVHDKFPAFAEFELVMRFVRYRNNYHSRVIPAAELPQVLESLVQQIAIEEDQRRHAAFEPTPGSWCSFCAYHHTCPVIERLRTESRDDLSVPDDDAARALAGDVIAVEAFAAAAKERLKAYLGGDHARGYVPVAGGTYGYAPVNSREVDADALRAVLEEHGIAADVWKPDLVALDRLIKKLPANMATAVGAAIRKSTTSRCQFRKGPPPSRPAAAVGAVEQPLFGEFDA